MPKLSWKERQNLYERIKMDEQERKEWEGLGVAITPERKRRLEDFQSVVDMIEGNAPPAPGIYDPHGGITNLDAINAKVRAQNERAERMTACVKCGQTMPRKDAQTKNKLAYCGYCYAVCFSERDDKWPPKITKGDSTRGMHRA